jgi:hypothetical protein
MFSDSKISYKTTMRKNSKVFLQAVIVLIGFGALALLLWEPHLEGRNVNATLFEIYFKDPFLAYAYLSSIPFFIALRQGFKVVGYAEPHRVFSPKAAKALKTIKYCAISIIGFAALGEIFILSNESDDRAGGVFIGVLISVGSILVAATAAKIERRLSSGK